jgi:hypothetical protein
MNVSAMDVSRPIAYECVVERDAIHQMKKSENGT